MPTWALGKRGIHRPLCSPDRAMLLGVADQACTKSSVAGAQSGMDRLEPLVKGWVCPLDSFSRVGSELRSGPVPPAPTGGDLAPRALTYAREALLGPARDAGVALGSPATLAEGTRFPVCLDPVLEGGHRGCDRLTLLVHRRESDGPRAGGQAWALHGAAGRGGRPGSCPRIRLRRP